MAAQIKWSDNAIQDYNNVVEYLLDEWNTEVALRFIEIVELKIKLLLSHPNKGLVSSKIKDIRSISITKHNRLYYRAMPEQVIEILGIFDLRQNPLKNRFE
jgi:plasmid stabilization system protein ParE